MRIKESSQALKMLEKHRSLLIQPRAMTKVLFYNVYKSAIYRGKVVSVPSSAEALAKLEDDKDFEFIFVDYSLGREDLLKFFELASEKVDLEKVKPILLVPSREDKGALVAELFLAGYKGFLCEPFSSDALSNLVRTTLSANPNQQEKQNATAQFLISEAARLIDSVAAIMDRGGSAPKLMKSLNELKPKLRDASEALGENFSKLIINEFENATTKKKEASKRSSVVTGPAPHPGSVLLKIISERGIDKKQLSKKLEINNAVLELVLEEKHPISDQVAEKLAIFVGNGADFWKNLQRNYELTQSKSDESK